jgi:ribosomal protein L11 methylase PrmA
MKKDAAVVSPTEDGWTGGSVWEAAEVLTNLLSEEPARVHGKRVLELGSGCGLSGLAAGALGAKEVMLTDEVLFMAAHNLDANFLDQPSLHQRFKLQQLSWGNKDQIAAAQPPFDVILCSDLLYDGGQHKELVDTLIELSSPGTHVLMTTPDGMPQDKSFWAKRFYWRLRQHGFQSLELSQDEPRIKRSRISLESGGGFDRGPIRIVQMSMGDAPLSD